MKEKNPARMYEAGGTIVPWKRYENIFAVKSDA